MDIRGGVRLIKQVMDGMKTTVCTVKESIHSMLLSLNTVGGSVQKIQSALQSVRAWIKLNKDLLVALIQIQVELLTKHVSTRVLQIRGQIGKLRQKVVSLIPQRVLNLLKRGQ